MRRLFAVFAGAAVLAASCSDESDRVPLGPSPVVPPPAVEFVALGLDSSRLRGVVPAGDVFEIVSRARYRVGNAQRVVPHWTVRPPQLLELVDPAGTFRALAPGTAHIAASYTDPRDTSRSAVSASVDVKVTRDTSVPLRLRIEGWSSGRDATLEVGRELRLDAVLE